MFPHSVKDIAECVASPFVSNFADALEKQQNVSNVSAFILKYACELILEMYGSLKPSHYATTKRVFAAATKKTDLCFNKSGVVVLPDAELEWIQSQHTKMYF